MFASLVEWPFFLSKKAGKAGKIGEVWKFSELYRKAGNNAPKSA